MKWFHLQAAYSSEPIFTLAFNAGRAKVDPISLPFVCKQEKYIWCQTREEQKEHYKRVTQNWVNQQMTNMMQQITICSTDEASLQRMDDMLQQMSYLLE